MANKVLQSTGVILDSDYKDIKWVGKDKGGKAVKIEVFNAINKENIDWTLAEKDEVVATLTYEGTYEDSALEDGDRTAPYKVTYADGTSVDMRDAKAIILGIGKFYIGDTYVGLTRGGGQFTSERTFRAIAADGDPGDVKGREELDEERPKLTMNLLQILGNLDGLYPATSVTDEA